MRELRDHQRELEQQIDGENEKIQQVADELAVEKQLFDKEKAMIEEKRRKILEDEVRKVCMCSVDHVLYSKQSMKVKRSSKLSKRSKMLRFRGAYSIAMLIVILVVDCKASSIPSLYCAGRQSLSRVMLGRCKAALQEKICYSSQQHRKTIY